MTKEAKEGEGKMVFVGCDDGHDSVKLVARAVTDSGITHKLTIPSKVVRGTRAMSLMGGDAGTGGVYQVGEESYTVTDALASDGVLDTRSIGYYTHPVNRILVHDAMLRADLGGEETRLVTGLPVNDYYQGAQPNTATIEAKRANILNPDIKPKNSNVQLAKIISHNVACEAVAAVYDMAINDDGRDNEDFYNLLAKAPVGVIDIGGKTTDLAVVYLDRNAPIVDMQRTSSQQFGMLKVAELIVQNLKMKHDVEEIAPRALFRVMSERKLHIYGEDVDVHEQVEAAVAKVRAELQDRIKTVWQRAQDLSKVIVVGGGSYLLTPVIKDIYPHTESRPEPEYANARGMLKLAMRSYLQKKSA